MNILKSLGFLPLFLLLNCIAGAQQKPEKENWIKLFNGKDLTGWDIKIAKHKLNENFGNTFRVENGIMRLAYDQYKTFDGKYGHMYYKTPFSYYKIRFEYRFVGNQTPGGDAWNVRNSGIMVHSQSAASMGKLQDFPVSIEIQLLGGLGQGERHTANLCTPGTQIEMNGKLVTEHCIDSHSKTYDGDQWVTVEAEVLGDSVISHIIAGDTVLQYNKPQVSPDFVGTGYSWEKANVKDADKWKLKAGQLLKEGYIAVQAESHPIDFRKIELLNLVGCMNKKCKNYKAYYVKQGKCVCSAGRK